MPDLLPAAPPAEPLKGKEFEELLLFRARQMEKRGALTMGRYGVQGSMFGKPGEDQHWQPIPSLPDFEGVLPSGRQFILEVKVTSSASFPISDKLEERQLAHMLRRSRFNALCFLVVHFNGRKLQRKADPPVTYAMPVSDSCPFWQSFARREVSGLRRDHCELYAIEMPWNLYSERAKKLTPDLLALFDREGRE